ncbi:hypothetical protein Taro_051186, partial [Colocasia esculenta]|nr:hypothetical protein [Colocasia esculenta]
MPGTSRNPGLGPLAWQDHWPSNFQLKNLASIDIDAKLLGYQLPQKPRPIPQMHYHNQKELKGIVPYLKMHLNLLNPPDSYQTLRELLRRLHLAPAIPCLIRHHLTFHDPPTSLLQPLEAVGKQGHENRARERENGVRELPS